MAGPVTVVQTLNKPIVLLQWSVVIPRVGDSIVSDGFELEGKMWKFTLRTNWDEYKGDEEWTMRLEKWSMAWDFKKFCLTAYVKTMTRDIYVGHQEISSLNNVIWRYGRRAFSTSYPSIKVTEKIDFSFECVNLENSAERFVNEHKSTQTSLCMNDGLCMENLSLDLRKLLEDGPNPDVQLKCGDCVIPAHRLILGARSEVFRTMLQSDMLEGREGSVEIVDMEPKIFEIFIRYLYTGILPELAEDTAAPLYEAGDKYRLDALKIRCGEFLADNITLTNACDVLVMVDAHSDHQMKDRVVSYIINEKVPDNDDEWRKFCDEHPRLANEVLNRAWKCL